MDAMQVVSRIFQRHARLMRSFGGDTELFRYALISALDELVGVMQAADIAEEHKYLDSVVRRVEAAIEKHDSGLYVSLAEGDIELPTAVERLLQRYSVAAYKHAEESAAEIVALREQLAQMDADNALLTDELRILRSWVTTPQIDASFGIVTTNGDMTTTATGKTRTVSEMLAVIADAANVNATPGLSWPGELADWVEGLEMGRHDWRKLAKSVRWQLIANVVNQVKDSVQFDAHRPSWMTSSRAAALTFGDGRWDKVVERAHSGEVVL